MRRRIWKRPFCGRWKRSFSNWGWVSVSWAASSGCKSTTGITTWTCCSITASCAAWSRFDLKLGKFEATDKGQMELYLGWLKRYAYEPDEADPLGMILYAGRSEEHIALLQLQKSGHLRGPGADGGGRGLTM